MSALKTYTKLLHVGQTGKRSLPSSGQHLSGRVWVGKQEFLFLSANAGVFTDAFNTSQTLEKRGQSLRALPGRRQHLHKMQMLDLTRRRREVMWGWLWGEAEDWKGFLISLPPPWVRKVLRAHVLSCAHFGKYDLPWLSYPAV